MSKLGENPFARKKAETNIVRVMYRRSKKKTTGKTLPNIGNLKAGKKSRLNPASKKSRGRK